MLQWQYCFDNYFFQIRRRRLARLQGNSAPPPAVASTSSSPADHPSTDGAEQSKSPSQSPVKETSPETNSTSTPQTDRPSPGIVGTFWNFHTWLLPHCFNDCSQVKYNSLLYHWSVLSVDWIAFIKWLRA